MEKQCPQCGLKLDVKKFTLQLNFKANVPGVNAVHNITYFLKCPACDYASPLRNSLEELKHEIIQTPEL